jgi:hypothetical protein
MLYADAPSFRVMTRGVGVGMKAEYLDDFYRIEDCNKSKDLLIAFLKSDVQVSEELLLSGERDFDSGTLTSGQIQRTWPQSPSPVHHIE